MFVFSVFFVGSVSFWGGGFLDNGCCLKVEERIFESWNGLGRFFGEGGVLIGLRREGRM